MILKPLIALSIICNLIGFNLSAANTDQKIADSYSRENFTLAMAASQNLALPEILSSPVAKQNSPKPNILTKEYVLIDGETGKLLISKNPDTNVPIASTTKIMTAVVALENYKLDDVVTVSLKATQQIPTVVNLRSGEKITVSELLHCLLIKSGNDSAYAIGAFMDKTEDTNYQLFVDRMNSKAKELGMDDTHYLDPAGLSDDGYSSAADLATVTRYALQNPTFREIVDTQNYVATNTTKTIFHQLENSNRLVTTYQYPGAIGVKTGFTDAASHCLVGAAKRNGHTLIAVILGTYSNSNSSSADEARKLLDWGFANIVWPN
ncbi:MAG: D-alanyl-D-alanine carboxypeptidase [Candidatus Berkelbacteria bacterium]|nr:D-alanyl-D-alanine carboxypeptidase [Candidatus Berkelbacteria bacterium]